VKEIQMRNVLKATTILVAMSASPAFADDKMEIGGFLGLHLWNDNNELGAADAGPPEQLDTTPIFGVRISRRLHRVLSVEAELGLAPGTTRDTGTDVVAIGYRLHAMVHPARFVDGKLEPFALLGAGGFTSASSDTGIYTNDTDFVWHMGVGLKYRLGRDWGVRFDARLLLPPANSGLVTADGELLVGVYKTFPAPAAKPTSDLFPPKSQPLEPTPVDQDGDGVVDASDRCPADPEDRDGYQDDDGCPEPDNDGDGVPDAADRCPAEPETANTFQDDDGCPDEAPASVKQFTGAVPGIEFANGSDRLTPASSTVLDAAVKVLGEYPVLRFEISGHTDSVGDPTFNRDLSRRRAEAVKTYLVSKGIAADRLETAGHGADQPVADNATPEGRAKNRRVEFKPR
jgi:OOP family OmpA-OmpF porin